MTKRLSRAEKGVLGRILTLRSCWVFTDENTEYTDITGRHVTLVDKRGVMCGNSRWEGLMPRFDKAHYWWVPVSKCRQCPFYAKRDEQFSFPRCTWRAKALTKEDAQLVVITERVTLFNKALKMFGTED